MSDFAPISIQFSPQCHCYSFVDGGAGVAAGEGGGGGDAERGGHCGRRRAALGQSPMTTKG
eukprot:3516098-Pyramimonas_sp.AAC.1